MAANTANTTNTQSTMLILSSAEGTMVTISRQAARQSRILRDMMDDLPEQELNYTVPLPNIDGATLQKIVDWCETYTKETGGKDPNEGAEARFRDRVKNFKGTETAAELQDIEPNFGLAKVADWENKLFGHSSTELLTLLMGANYLDINTLLHHGAAAVANNIKGKTVEQMREYFHITNDFTDEEMDQLRKHGGWAEIEMNKNME